MRHKTQNTYSMKARMARGTSGMKILKTWKMWVTKALSHEAWERVGNEARRTREHLVYVI